MNACGPKVRSYHSAIIKKQTSPHQPRRCLTKCPDEQTKTIEPQRVDVSLYSRVGLMSEKSSFLTRIRKESL